MTVEEIYELAVSPLREWWKALSMTIRALGRGDFVPVAIARVIYRSTWVQVTTRVLDDRVVAGDLCRTKDGRTAQHANALCVFKSGMRKTMNNDPDNRSDEQAKLDAIEANFQDAQDAFDLLAEIARHVALRFRLVADPLFMARPNPIKLFSDN